MTKANEHAFPRMTIWSDGRVELNGGLTKREYFAAMALQGLVACPETAKARESMEQPWNMYAKAAIKYADALLAELEKQQ